MNLESALSLRRIHLLERIHDYDGPPPPPPWHRVSQEVLPVAPVPTSMRRGSRVPDPPRRNPYANLVPLDLVVPKRGSRRAARLWEDTVDSLVLDGMISLTSVSGEFHSVHGFDFFRDNSALLLNKGFTEVEAIRVRRKDPVQRRRAAQGGLLSWLYQRDLDGHGWAEVEGVLGTRFALVAGAPLTKESIVRAAGQLIDDSLIEAHPKPAEDPAGGAVRITLMGKECVESGKGVDGFMSEQRKQAGQVNNTYFQGSVSNSNISWASTHVSQEMTTSTGVAGDEIMNLVRAIAQALPALELTNGQSEQVRRSAEVVQGELAQQEPDEHIVKTMLKRMLEPLVTAAGGALGAALGAYGQMLLVQAGIPIEIAAPPAP